ncbi:MAG: carbohydrate ABC transporter permease [Fimbriimonadaceae bacterium]|nr:carbohydrate ABC transporter permease [Fimbriimonadaceae bacterium]
MRPLPLSTRAVLILYAMTLLVPIAWVCVSSLKTSAEIFASPWAFPTTPQWKNYAAAWSDNGLSRYFLNSCLVTGASLAVLIPVGSAAAYVLARYPFPGNRLIYTLILGGMMFPNFLVIAPLTDLLRKFGLMNQLSGLVTVYVAFSLAFTVFVLHGFYQSVPKELEEAARLDGCDDARLYRRVMMPLATPGLVVVTIFNGLGLWNEFNLALVLANQESLRTLPVGLANLTMSRQYQADWGSVFAALVIVMAPAFALYWTFRERVQEAMLAGSIK